MKKRKLSRDIKRLSYAMAEAIYEFAPEKLEQITDRMWELMTDEAYEPEQKVEEADDYNIKVGFAMLEAIYRKYGQEAVKEIKTMVKELMEDEEWGNVYRLAREQIAKETGNL